MAAQQWSEWIGLTITVVIVGLVILGTLRISKRLEGPKPKPKRESDQVSRATWTFLVLLVALIAYVVSSQKKPGQPAGPEVPSWVGGLIVVGVVGGFIGVPLAVYFYKNYDRDASKAAKLANSGDVEGAILLLETAMEERKPSAIRSYTLGQLYGMREQWAEAYKAFVDAEAIGGRQAEYIGSQGLALWKLGRFDDAFSAYQAASMIEPTYPTYPFNLAFLLAEERRFDEAAEQLRIAEAKYKTFVMIPPSAKKPIGDEIAKLRARLEIEKGPAIDEIAGS